MAKTTTTIKKVVVLCGLDVHFSIADESIAAGALTVEQAELVDAQYPGMYVKIVNEKAPEIEAKTE